MILPKFLPSDLPFWSKLVRIAPRAIKIRLRTFARQGARIGKPPSQDFNITPNQPDWLMSFKESVRYNHAHETRFCRPPGR